MAQDTTAAFAALVKEIRGLRSDLVQEKTKKNRISRVTRARGSGMITSEEIIGDFKKLQTEVQLSTKEMAKARSYSLGVWDGLKNLITPATNLKRALNSSVKQLHEHLRHQDKNFQSIALNTQKSFHNIMDKSEELAKSLNGIVKANEAFKNTFETFDAHFDVLKKQTDARMKMEASAKKEAELKTKASKRNAPDNIKEDHAKAMKASSRATDAFNALQGQTAGFKKTWESFFNQMEALEQRGIKVFEGIEKSELAYEAFSNKSNDEQEAIKDKLSANLKAVNMGVAGFDSTVKNYTEILNRNKDKLKSSLKLIGIGLITRGLPKVMDDYMARQKYNVSQANPMAAANMGMSSGDLATLIGQNKTLFRVMGKGDENAPINNGQLKDLQNAAKMFGVNGKEAAELAIQFADLNMAMGNSPATIKQQMDDFKKLSGVTGMTVDELHDFYKDLNKTGVMNTLNARYANKSESERVSLINKEVDYRVRLNKELGYNIDHLKAQNQLAINQQNAGIEETIMRVIGAKIATSAYNKANPDRQIDANVVATDEPTLQAMSKTEAGKQKAMEIRLQQQALQDFMNKQQDTRSQTQANNITGGGKFNPALMASARVIQQISGNMNQDLLGNQPLQERREAAGREQGQLGPDAVEKILAGNTKDLWGDLAKKTLDQMKVEDVGKASDKTTYWLDKLGDSTKTVIEKLKGFNDSVLGSITNLAGYGGLLSSLSNLLVSGRLSKLLTTVGAGGAEKLTADAIGTSVASKLGSVALRVSILAAAGVVSYEIGQAVGEAIDSSDYASNVDKIIDAKYGKDASGIEATLERLVRKFTLPGFIDTRLRGLDSDQAVQAAQQKEAATNWLQNRFQGRLKNVAFGNNKLGDDIVQAALKSGAINNDYIKSYDAPNDYINQINKQDFAKSVLNPDDVDGGDKDKKWQDAMIQLNDRDQKKYDEDKAAQSHAMTHAEAKDEVNKRIASAKKMAYDASTAALGSVPHYTGT